MPSFSFSNPLSGRRVASAQDGGLPRPGNGGKGHRSKLSTTPAITGSSSHRPERPGLVPERHSSNTTGFPRPSISASSSTQDVRLASFNNTSQATNAAGSGMRNVAGLKGEQKVIAVLINRLVSKLPATTGSSLGATEGDPIVQQTITALEKISETKLALVAPGLTAVLEGFIPQTANLSLANQPIHVLQSQYIILKAMQHCTTSYWKYHHEQNTGFAARHGLENYPRTWSSPPAIEEALARSMVTTLLHYVIMSTYEVTAAQTGVKGRTAPVPGTFGIKGENDQTPMGRSMLRFLHGFSTSSDVGLKYRTEKSMEGKADGESPGGLMSAPEGSEMGSPPMSPGSNKKLGRSPHLGHLRSQSFHSISSVASASDSASASALMCEIARQVGKIFYFLSTAAWNVVYSKIKTTLTSLAQSSEEHPDAVDIRILEWANLDQGKLSTIIKDFAVHFSHVKRAVQPALAVAIHSAIWNWIEGYPTDFILLHQKGKRIDSGAETLFDVVHSMATTSEGQSKAKAFWPTQAALLLVCPETLDKAIHGEAGSNVSKKSSFLASIRKSGKASYMDEPTLLCYVDFCKAGSAIPLGNYRYALHEYVRDVRSDFQERLLHDNNVMELLDINLLICGFVALHRSRFLDTRAWSPMLSFMKEARSLRCRKVVAHSALILILESDNQPHAPPLAELQTAAAPFFRVWLGECISHWTSEGNWKPTYEVDLNILDTPTYMAREKMLLDAILKVYAAEPAFAFDGTGQSSMALGVSDLLFHLSKGAFHLRSAETARDCERCLLALQRWAFTLPLHEADAEAHQLAVSLVSDGLLYESCRFVGQSLFTSQDDKHHARMMNRLTEQAILTAKAGRLLASRRHTSDLWYNLAKTEFLADIVVIASLLSADFETNTRTIVSLGVLAKYRPDTGHTIDRDMKIMRESATAVFQHIHENLDGIFGKIQQQKLIRNTFKSSAQPCAPIRTLWQLLFSRFAELTTRVVDGVDLGLEAPRHDSIPALNSCESGLWKNLGLFLSSTSDICCAVDKTIEVPQEWVAEVKTVGSVSGFVEAIVDLFVANSEGVREATKQMAGEIALPHLNLLINQVKSLMEHTWTDGHINRSEAFDCLVATSMGTFRFLMERDAEEKFAGDLAQQPDFGSLLFCLADYVNVMPFGPISHRCKIKLGRIVTRIGDKLALEPIKRDRLFANLQSWTSQGLKEAGNRNFRDLSNIQQCEDDITFLNGLAQLSAAMLLGVGAEGMARSSVKIMGDAEFFARFIQRISIETAEHQSVYAFRMMKQAQAILNNLIASNGNECLGQCLDMTLSADAGLRYPFLQAMTVMLKQSSMNDLTLRRTKSDISLRPFTKMLLQRDVSRMKPMFGVMTDIGCASYQLALVQAITSTAMIQEFDILSAVLYRIFQREGGVYVLLVGLLEHEVRLTENQSQLFRANSIVTRIITQHVKTSGFAYFRSLLLPTVEAVSNMSLEMEQTDVIKIVDDLLNRVIRIADVPAALRHLFNSISCTTLTKFEASRHAVSSFFFLRVLCPALVSPERFDIVVADDRRRILLLISKIIMNVANVQSFGTKDPQLAVYNDLLEAKYQAVVDFLTELGAAWPEPVIDANRMDKSLALFDADVDEDFIAFYIINHLDQVAQAEGIDAAQVTSIARSFEQRQPKRVKSNATAQANAYSEFMRRNEARSVSHEKIFFRGQASTGGDLEVFYLVLGSSRISFNDLLLWHIFKTLEGCSDFDLVIDLTRSNSTQTPMATFIERFLELCPKAILSKWKTIILFQPNIDSPRLLMNFHMLLRVLGASIDVSVVTASTPSQLMKYTAMSSIKLSRDSLMVSEAPKTTYQDISFEMHDGRRLPVTVALKNDLVVLRTTAKQELLPFEGISSELVAVFDVSELGDEILSKFQGQGSRPLIQYLKEARKPGLHGYRRRYEIRENKGQSTIAVAVLASALFNLVASNSTKTQRSAVDLLRAGENCFKFGLGNDTPKYEDVQTFSMSVATASKTGNRLIKLVPHLSLGMSLEFMKAMGHVDGEHRISLVQLSIPWFQQSVEVVQPFSTTYIANMASMRELVRGMIELTVGQEEHWSAWLEPLWRALSHASDDIMDVILGEILEVVQGSEMEKNAWKGLQAALRSFAANGLIVKLASRLRKKIAATYTNTCPVLADSAAWPEISCLLQAVFLRISASIPQSDIFIALPDICYALVMTAGLGAEKIRTCAHSVTCRLIELCVEENTSDATSDLLMEAQSEEMLSCYGLVASKDPDTAYTTIVKTEKLCSFLLRILMQSAPTLDLQNVWLARLVGLFSASCFQYNPAVQQRALVALGILINGARPGEVEDDFMYQLLVAIHNALAQPISPVSDMLLISMLRCGTLVISGVSANSRYGGAATFWLGLGILQTGRIPLISAALDLLVACLKAGGLGQPENGLQGLLLAHRPRDMAVIKLDAYTGVDFDSDISFTFSVSAMAYRGMRLNATRTATKELFGLLMAPALTPSNAQIGLVQPHCLAYFLCRYSVKNNNAERKYLVDLTCGKGTFDRLPNHADVFGLLDIPDTSTAIMVIALLFGMLRAAELEYERVFLLTTLAEAARQLPEIMAIWQTYAHNELVNYLLQSSNPQIFLAVNTILTIIGNPPSRDDLRDDASRISHDTRTSVEFDLDSHATLRDLKMLSLNQMGSFRIDPEKMTKISVLVSQLIAP